MGTVKLFFLGSEYSISQELKQYVEYLQYFETFRSNLMGLLNDQIKNKQYSGGADEDFAYYKNPITQIGKQIITLLSDNGIYDATIEEFVYNNDGYIQLHNVCKETMQGMIDILMNAMSEWERGYNNAYSAASSKVTGSGVGIITNSVTSALVYSMMEASTLKKQSDKASQEYTAAIERLNENVEDRQERQKIMLLTNKYYPGIANSIEMFVVVLMEKFLNKLKEFQIFDYSSVEKYSLKRSSNILKNIPLVSDKRNVIVEAFRVCPYNPDVYQAVLDYLSIDVETFITAKYLLQDQILLPSIIEYAHKKCNDYLEIDKVTKILTSYTQKSEKVLLQEIYREDLRTISREYSGIANAMRNNNDLVLWILKKELAKNAYDLCSISTENLIQQINDNIQNIISEEKFVFYWEQQLIDMSKLQEFIEDNENYDKINYRLVYVLVKRIKDYQIKLQENRQYYLSEAKVIKKQYGVALSEYRHHLEILKNKVAMLQEKRRSLGIFAISQKKEIDKQIQDVASKMELYQQKPLHIKLEATYNQLLRKANDFI